MRTNRTFTWHHILLSAAIMLGTAASAQEVDSGAAAPTQSVQLDDGWPELIPTSAFASRTALRSAKLSPDGAHLAVQTTVKGRAKIAIFDAETRDLVETLDVGRGDWMNWFRWAGPNRILYSIDGNGFSTSRRYLMTGQWTTSLMVYDRPSKATHFIGFKEQGFEGDDVLYTDPAGEYVILSLSLKVGLDPDVYRYPLDGSGANKAVRVQKRRKGIDEWWADNKGVVRIGMRWQNHSKLAFFYRGSAEEDWIEVAKVNKHERDEVDNWDFLSIRAGTDTGYALVRDETGRKVLREFDYRTGTSGAIVYSHPSRDIRGVQVDSEGVLIAATYEDDAPRTHWFDPDLKNTQSQLEAALGAGRVRLSPVAGTERMIVRHGDANDPGAMYIFTPSQRNLDLFSEYRPDVDFQQLADVRVITYTARDGTPIEGYLTLPKGKPKPESNGKYPLILLPHGGPYGIRDSLIYNDEVQLLANRGYAVLQPNFRGSGGYGEAFEELGNGQIGRKMQDDLDDAMDWAVAEGHVDPGRVCVVGGSYGGFAALWAVIRNPERYRCAASWAGVTDFDEQLKHDRDYFTRRAGRRWRKRVEGEQTILDLDDFSPAKQVARLTRPVLLAHGTSDRVVPFAQFTAFKDAAEEHGKPIETLMIRREGHGFSSKSNERRWYDALEAFLAEHNPTDRPPTPEKDETDGSGGIKRVDEL